MRQPETVDGPDSTAPHSGARQPTVLGRHYWTYAVLILLSFAGSIAHVIAVTWLLLRGSHGPTYVSVAFLISAVPAVLLFRIARRQVAAEKLPSRLSVLDAIQAVVVVAVPVSAALGHPPARAVLLGQEFLLSCCGAFVFPLSRAMLVRAAPRGATLTANGVSAAVFQTGNSLGALAGGLLVAVAGPYTAMAVNAGTFVVSAVGLAAMVRPVWQDEPDPKAPGRDHADTAGQARQQGRSTRSLLGYLVLGTVVLLTMQRLFLGSLGPLVQTHLRGTPLVQGVLQFAFTVGGVLGGIVVGKWARESRRGRELTAILVLSAASFLVLAASSSALLSCTACFLLGVAVSHWSVFQSDIQATGGAAAQAHALAHISMWQSVAAVIVFTGTAALTLVLQPRFVFAAFGLILIALGLLATHETQPVSVSEGDS